MRHTPLQIERNRKNWTNNSIVIHRYESSGSHSDEVCNDQDFLNYGSEGVSSDEHRSLFNRVDVLKCRSNGLNRTDEYVHLQCAFYEISVSVSLVAVLQSRESKCKKVEGDSPRLLCFLTLEKYRTFVTVEIVILMSRELLYANSQRALAAPNKSPKQQQLRDTLATPIVLRMIQS